MTSERLKAVEVEIPELVEVPMEEPGMITRSPPVGETAKPPDTPTPKPGETATKLVGEIGICAGADSTVGRTMDSVEVPLMEGATLGTTGTATGVFVAVLIGRGAVAIDQVELAIIRGRSTDPCFLFLVENTIGPGASFHI